MSLKNKRQLTSTDLGACEQFSCSPNAWFANTHYRQDSPTFRGFPLPTQAPSLIARGQLDSCCFLSLGTTRMLQSQSPSREDGVSLSWSRGSRWDYAALYPQMWSRLRLSLVICAEKDHMSTNIGLHPQVYTPSASQSKISTILWVTKLLFFFFGIPVSWKRLKRLIFWPYIKRKQIKLKHSQILAFLCTKITCAVSNTDMNGLGCFDCRRQERPPNIHP